MTEIPIAEAVAQLRDQLRQAILEGRGQDVIFAPKSVELELSVSFSADKEAGGGVKLLAFLDLSGKAKSSEATQHKLKLVLDVTDREGRPIKVRSDSIPSR